MVKTVVSLTFLHAAWKVAAQYPAHPIDILGDSQSELGDLLVSFLSVIVWSRAGDTKRTRFRPRRPRPRPNELAECIARGLASTDPTGELLSGCFLGLQNSWSGATATFPSRNSGRASRPTTRAVSWTHSGSSYRTFMIPLLRVSHQAFFCCSLEGRSASSMTRPGMTALNSLTGSSTVLGLEALRSCDESD